MVPNLRPYAEPLTNAMVEFYLKSQERFTQDMQPHYVYSPREMTRWVRGICEAVRPLDSLSIEGLVRLYVHEGLRLFQDRLVHDEERAWTNDSIDQVLLGHTNSIFSFFCEKSITPRQENTVLFRSSPPSNSLVSVLDPWLAF